MTTDFYSILGVDPAATMTEIKERFRFLCHAYHPDKFATAAQREAAEEEIKRINEAYQVLSNPAQRANYDRERARQTDTKFTAGFYSPSPPSPQPSTNDSVGRPGPGMSKHEIFVVVSWLVAGVMVILATVAKHPYSFYMLLRWICCPVFAYSAFVLQKRKAQFWSWTFGILAVLYNPVWRVHLDRSVLTAVNWLTAGALAVAALVFWREE